MGRYASVCYAEFAYLGRCRVLTDAESPQGSQNDVHNRCRTAIDDAPASQHASLALQMAGDGIVLVAVLSVFVMPMTEIFGWSRSLFAEAVSLGGICAVFI
jgi:hypothetical protein